MMFARWLSTVFTLIASVTATALLPLPPASKRTISRSRGRERGARARRPAPVAPDRADEGVRQARSEERAMARQRLDGGEEVARRVGLEHVAPRSRREHIRDELLGLVHGEDQDLGPRQALSDPPRHLEHVHARHHRVQDGDVGPARLGTRDRLLAARRLGAHFPALRREEVLQPTSNHLVIVRDQDPDHAE